MDQDITKFFQPQKPAIKHVKFVAEQEPWCEWHLEDGTIIKAKLVLMRATIDPNDAVNPDGTLKYMVSFQQVADCIPSALALATYKGE